MYQRVVLFNWCLDYIVYNNAWNVVTLPLNFAQCFSGFSFPQLREADAMFAAEVLPDWKDGEVCFTCRTSFSTFNRKVAALSCSLPIHCSLVYLVTRINILILLLSAWVASLCLIITVFDGVLWSPKHWPREDYIVYVTVELALFRELSSLPG